MNKPPAQGDGLLAWLDRAISERETAVRRLVGVGGCPDWGHCRPDCTHDNRDADVQQDVTDRLRRYAADRKLLILHQAVPDHGRYSEPECPADCDGQHEGPPVCMACRDYAGDPLEAPCHTVLTIAEGYGWTEKAQRSCGDAKRHPSHTFMRMEVLFQCPGMETADNGTES